MKLLAIIATTVAISGTSAVAPPNAPSSPNPPTAPGPVAHDAVPMVPVEFTGTSEGWYDVDANGVPFWNATSTYNSNHIRFPRGGDKVIIPAGATVSFAKSETPTSYTGAVQGEMLIVEGTLIMEDEDDNELIIDENVAASQPVHCQIGAWGGYSTCTLSCASGAQNRQRSFTQPTKGGDQCPHSYETRPCNTHNCPEDGVMGQWGQYSTCTVSCTNADNGGGAQTRSRSCQSPQFGGEACKHGLETRGCNAAPCPIDCTYGGWSGYSDCTKPCNVGSYSRSRSVTQPQFGGVACPHSEETAECNTQNCPTECSHTSCKYVFRDDEWRTVVMHSACLEQNGMDYHCEHHFGTQQLTLLGGEQKTHTDECKCYCDFEGGSSSITHRHIGYDSATSLTHSAHALLARRVRHLGGGSHLSCA